VRGCELLEDKVYGVYIKLKKYPSIVMIIHIKIGRIAKNIFVLDVSPFDSL